jgi:hypothetical protein
MQPRIPPRRADKGRLRALDVDETMTIARAATGLLDLGLRTLWH